MTSDKFWETVPLSEMTQVQWESLCDGCAKCCIFKFEEDDTGHILQTDVVCKYLDLDKCSCTEYAKRKVLVPDCISITHDNILDLKWMPSSCSYRLLALGESLPEWHPLISGNSNSMKEADMTVQGHVISENEVDDIEDRIIGWFDPTAN